MAAREAAAIPLPREETTPPVTKIYLVISCHASRFHILAHFRVRAQRNSRFERLSRGLIQRMLAGVLENVETSARPVRRVDDASVVHEYVADPAPPLALGRLRKKGSNFLRPIGIGDIVDAESRAEPCGDHRVLEFGAARLGFILMDIVGADAAANPVQLLE